MAEPGPHMWYAALASPCGIAVKTNNPNQLVQRLYAIRRAEKNDDFRGLSIIRPPGVEDEIWIVPKVIGASNET